MPTPEPVLPPSSDPQSPGHAAPDETLRDREDARARDPRLNTLTEPPEQLPAAPPVPEES